MRACVHAGDPHRRARHAGNRRSDPRVQFAHGAQSCVSRRQRADARGGDLGGRCKLCDHSGPARRRGADRSVWLAQHFPDQSSGRLGGIVVGDAPCCRNASEYARARSSGTSDGHRGTRRSCRGDDRRRGGRLEQRMGPRRICHVRRATRPVSLRRTESRSADAAAIAVQAASFHDHVGGGAAHQCRVLRSHLCVQLVFPARERLFSAADGIGVCADDDRGVHCESFRIKDCGPDRRAYHDRCRRGARRAELCGLARDRTRHSL